MRNTGDVCFAGVRTLFMDIRKRGAQIADWLIDLRWARKSFVIYADVSNNVELDQLKGIKGRREAF